MHRLTCVPSLVLAALVAVATGRQVVLDNLRLPVDDRGATLLTGEADVLAFNGSFYVFMNNWGECAGIDCCQSSGGCASCCFNPPTEEYPDACVYTANHTVVVYETTDFSAWEYRGEALPAAARLPGIEFRPHVVYNAPSRRFVMWYEDRHTNQQGYAIATSTAPEGPYTTVANSVSLPGAGRIGDYDIFIDDDGSAYHVRTGFTIVKLNATYTGGTNETSSFETPKPSEAPVMFKRNGLYYILAGTGCCACRGGSNVYVLRAKSPMGPYEFLGDIGSNPSPPFSPSSPSNYVTRAQATAVVEVPSSTGGLQYLWLGNQWVTSTQPGRPRNQDLLYWTLLSFGADGSIPQLQWQNETALDVNVP